MVEPMNCTWYMTDFTGPKIGYIHLKSNDLSAAIRDVQFFIGAAIKNIMYGCFQLVGMTRLGLRYLQNHPLKCQPFSGLHFIQRGLWIFLKSSSFWN